MIPAAHASLRRRHRTQGDSFVAERAGLCRSRPTAIPPSRDAVSGPPQAASQNACVLVEPGFYIPPIATNANAPWLGRQWRATRREGLRPSRLEAIRPSLRDRRKRRHRTHAFWSNPGSTSLPSPQTQTPHVSGVSGVRRGGRDCGRLALRRSVRPCGTAASGVPERMRVLIPPRATKTNAPFQGRFCLWRRGRDSNPR